LETRNDESPGDQAQFPSIFHYERFWGVRWVILGRTQTERNRFSKSVKRLESLGLVLRQNSDTGKQRKSPADPFTRTSNVQLTPAGWEVYQRLEARPQYYRLTESDLIELLTHSDDEPSG
jgi:hypothetical protein